MAPTVWRCQPRHAKRAYGDSRTTSPRAFIKELPLELLEQIALALDKSCTTNKTTKDAFYALKNSSPLFSRLSITNKALFREIHIFVTPASTARLEAISQHPVLRQHVQRVVFHRPALSEPDEIEVYHADDDRVRILRITNPFTAANQSRADSMLINEQFGLFQGNERANWYHSYSIQEYDMSSGYLADEWARAMSCFGNVTALEITANPDPDQFMTIHNPHMACFSAAYLPPPTDWTQQLMRRLYPKFVAPYAFYDMTTAELKWSRDFRQRPGPLPDLKARADTVFLALDSLSNANVNNIENLVIDGLLRGFPILDWPSLTHGVHSVQRLTLSSLAGYRWHDDLRAMLPTMTCLTELRLSGTIRPDHPMSSITNHLRDLHLPSIHILQLLNFGIDVETIIQFLLEQRTLRTLSVVGLIMHGSTWETELFWTAA